MNGRFKTQDFTVVDTRSGLMWTRDAGIGEFPLTWKEAFDFVADLNRQALYGFADWHLPNRRELFSLVSHAAINPALPPGHPFENVFSGYYWTSTTCARLPDQAWYVHLGGARVFKGMKYGSYMLWPVRQSGAKGEDLSQTGQRTCFQGNGQPMSCAGSGQDGEIRAGRAWPSPRFGIEGAGTRDRLTGLLWARTADLSRAPVSWTQARDLVSAANAKRWLGCDDWRLPRVRELESLCDMQSHSPALPAGHPFEQVRSFYWSDTTSQYDPTYAWVLYLQDGAVGVGHKPRPEFYVWPVR